MNLKKDNFPQPPHHLLNLTATCHFLGVSRRVLAQLESADPTFPKRKTKTKHSRVLLDEWLAQNGPSWYQQSEPQAYNPRTQRFALKLDSLN